LYSPSELKIVKTLVGSGQFASVYRIVLESRTLALKEMRFELVRVRERRHFLIVFVVVVSEIAGISVEVLLFRSHIAGMLINIMTMCVSDSIIDS
jgi:hypothetical protein